MKEFIERDVAIGLSRNYRIRGYFSIIGYELATPVRALKNIPAADVQPVVFCKDCAVPHNKWTGCPKLGGLVTEPDFFCAFGEPKGDSE